MTVRFDLFWSPSSLWLGLLLVEVTMGCSPSPINRGLVPITGQIHVDGSPAEGVMVTLHPESANESQEGSISTRFSGPDGTFQISTYQEGDGAAPGNYAVTFVWGEFNPISRSHSGDRFKGRYASVPASTFHWEVAGEQPLDEGTIELVTK